MPIYTKKGDKGTTNFIDKSKRVEKDSAKVETLGAIDELNSFLGIARSFCDPTSPKASRGRQSRDKFIKQIQDDLFTICAIIAGSNLKFNKSKTTRFEKEIDKIEERVKPISSFRFSQGSRFATHLMYARALARRAERRAVALNRLETIHPNILQYLNRLSDMIFMLFREANFDAGIAEEGWSPKK